MSITNFKGFVKLTEEQYQTLKTDGILTVNGTTINYEPTTTLYITPGGAGGVDNNKVDKMATVTLPDGSKETNAYSDLGDNGSIFISSGVGETPLDATNMSEGKGAFVMLSSGAASGGIGSIDSNETDGVNVVSVSTVGNEGATITAMHQDVDGSNTSQGTAMVQPDQIVLQSVDIANGGASNIVVTPESISIGNTLASNTTTLSIEGSKVLYNDVEIATKNDLTNVDVSSKVDKVTTTTLSGGSKVSSFYTVDPTTGATKITNVEGETDIPDDITSETTLVGSALRMDTESITTTYINIDNGDIYNTMVAANRDGIQSMVMAQDTSGNVTQNAVIVSEDQLVLQLYRPSSTSTNAANIVFNDDSILIGHQKTDTANNVTMSSLVLSGGKALYNDNEIATKDDIASAFNSITDSNGTSMTINEVATKATTAIQPEDVASTTDIDNLFA